LRILDIFGYVFLSLHTKKAEKYRFFEYESESIIVEDVTVMVEE